MAAHNVRELELQLEKLQHGKVRNLRKWLQTWEPLIESDQRFAPDERTKLKAIIAALKVRFSI